MPGINTDDHEAGIALCLEKDIVQGLDTSTRVLWQPWLTPPKRTAGMVRLSVKVDLGKWKVSSEDAANPVV
jgi:hypothetical protein